MTASRHASCAGGEWILPHSNKNYLHTIQRHSDNFNIFQTAPQSKGRRMPTVQDFWMRATRAVRQGAARFSMNAVQSHGESGTTIIIKRMIGEDSKLADSNAIGKPERPRRRPMNEERLFTTDCTYGPSRDI